MKRKKNSGATKRENDDDDEEKKAPLLPLRKNARRCRELGVELNTDATKLNNASQLLSILMSTSPSPPAASKSSLMVRRTREEEEREDALLFKTNTARDDKERDEEQRQKAKVESMLALEKFFAARLARGDVALARRDLLLSKKKKIREEDDGNDVNDVAEQKKRKYRAWLLQNYKLFLSRMIRVAAKDRTASEQTRVVAFSGLMEIARLDGGGGEDGDGGGSSSSNFNNEIFERALEECVRSKLWSDATLGMLKKRFLGRVDVQYYAYKAVARIAGRLAAASRKESGSKKGKEEGEDMDDDDDDDDEDDAGNGADMEASSAEVARNLYDVISNVSVDFEDYDPESTTTNPILNSSNNGGAKLTSKEVDFAAMLGLSSEDLAKAAAASNNNNEDDDDGKAETTPWCKMPSQTLDIDEQNDAKRRKKSNEKDLKKKKAATKTKNGSKISWMDGVKRRRAFSDAWIAFLRLPNFPEDVYRKILARLHLDVIPHHVNPVLLCDFCVSSVNVGGLIGMLALHALFVLVTRHNLEYPKFYDRLYNLINEDSFYANGRRTFFELADVFLKSPALPGYCAAAFCKKFGRLSLSAPPAGAMLCVSFIHNLIRRHPKSCLPLIHRDRDVLGGSGGGVNIDNADEDNTATEGDENVKQKSSSNKHRKSFDEDPYDFSTEDPAKSRALESSLWEMTALENHYFPQVTKLVQMLRMDLGDRVKTKEIDISGGGEAQHSLCSANYYSLLKEELDVRLKSVALKHGTIGDLGLFHSDEFVSAAGFGELIQWKED
jgi:hypothetical protein